MATTFEKLSSNKVKLGFVVEPEKFEEGLKKAYNKLKGRINIPGFRKGKAPMRVIETTTARAFSTRTRWTPSSLISTRPP